MKLIWSTHAWADYLWWQQNDRANTRRINRMIEEIMRDPASRGIGKPELLKGPLFAGFASRRITEEHRLVYKARADQVEIASCRGHYT